MTKRNECALSPSHKAKITELCKRATSEAGTVWGHDYRDFLIQGHNMSWMIQSLTTLENELRAWEYPVVSDSSAKPKYLPKINDARERIEQALAHLTKEQHKSFEYRLTDCPHCDYMGLMIVPRGVQQSC